MKLKKIISGGQSGSDSSGLKVAKHFGLECGGWIPKGFLTEFGPKPELGELYYLKEHSSSKYPPRTYSNVKDSDGTIRIAKNFNTAGERCTLKAIQYYKKPYIDVSMDNPKPIKEVIEWLENNNIETLNVAGNRETSAPGMTIFAINYLKDVILELKK